jgi:alpha-galactosidase
MFAGISYLALHGQSTSLVLEFSPTEAPIWRYWGKKLHHWKSNEITTNVQPKTLHPKRSARAMSPSALDFDQPLSTCVGLGLGWFSSPSLLVHRAGKDCFVQFTHARYAHDVEKNAITLFLTDAVTHIEVQQHLQIDFASDVLTMRTVLLNTDPIPDSQPLEVQWLAAATLPLNDQCKTVQSYKGQWANEFLVYQDSLEQGTWRRDSRRGRNGHDQFPGSLVMSGKTDEHDGLTYGAQLAWSGNHTQLIERLPDGGLQWQLGEWLAPGEVSLMPGEQLTSPEVVAVCSMSGLNGVAQSFHESARRRLKWPNEEMRPRPVHLNTWEAIYFDHQSDVLYDLAKQAAAIGVERFVLDDGWFPARVHDRAGLGDWWPDTKKYPTGLQPLAAEVERLGMEFGLWVEPEMVNPDSELFRQHPDWALRIMGRPLQTGRNQLVLDLSRTDVQDYLFDKLDAVLSSARIRYLKWDMNRDLSAAVQGRGEGITGIQRQAGSAAYRTNSLALYALLQRLRQAHPLVEIESCSSGGARIDMGILPYVHRFWASDTNDALLRINVQRGFMQFLPPELMGAHVGPVPTHTTGRTQALPFRAAVAMQGHMGVECDVRLMSSAEKTELATWITLYKSLRHILHQGRTWQGNCGDGIVWQAYAAADTDWKAGSESHASTVRRCIVIVYRTLPTVHTYSPALRLPMLEEAATYKVSRICPQLANVFHHSSSAKLFEQLEAGLLHFSGEWLCAEGLPLPRMKTEQAMVLEFLKTDF